MIQTAISKPAAAEFNPYYGRYIDLVPEGDIVEVLAGQIAETLRLLAPLTEAQALHRYAAGKWSVKEVVGHVADAERIFAYRALRIARGDATPLASFDENAYVPAGRFDARPLASIVAELSAARAATVALGRGLDAEAAAGRGVASGHPVTPRALFYIIAGHELHHRAILKERYGVGG